MSISCINLSRVDRRWHASSMLRKIKTYVSTYHWHPTYSHVLSYFHVKNRFVLEITREVDEPTKTTLISVTEQKRTVQYSTDDKRQSEVTNDERWLLMTTSSLCAWIKASIRNWNTLRSRTDRYKIYSTNHNNKFKKWYSSDSWICLS